MKTKLTRCPFCKGRPVVNVSGADRLGIYTANAACKKCHTSTADIYAYSKAKAIEFARESWNVHATEKFIKSQGISQGERLTDKLFDQTVSELEELTLEKCAE